MNKLPIIRLIIGGLTIIYTVFMLTVSNFNAGILIVFLIGVFIGVSKWIFDLINRIGHKWIQILIKAILLLGFTSVFLIAGMLAWVGFNDTTEYDEEAVIVLGAGLRGERVSLTLKYRLDRAIEYWNENPEAIIIVSGGQGPQELITEAEAMSRYLTAHDIPQDKIIKEENATSTFENFTFSKEILDNIFTEGYETAFITNDFHIYRAGKISDLAGVYGYSCAANTVWYSVPVVYAREVLVVVKSWVFGY